MQRHPSAYQQLQIMYTVSPKQDVYPIPQVPFAGCPMDCIWPLPTSSKGHRHALTFICLLTTYLITVPLKTKTADEVSKS